MGTGAVPRACSRYGCPHLQPCPEHGRHAQQREHNRQRGSSHQMGYGARWRAFTAWYRAALLRLDIAPLCGARLPGAPQTTDSLCAQRGRLTLGHVVDHIRPVTGPDDPSFYHPLAMQLLCDGRERGGLTGDGCHDRKRQRERRQP